MPYSKRSKYSPSPPPYKQYSRSLSRSLSRSRDRSRSPSSDVDNPGNNLYVTGLSPRITKRDLEKHFASEGLVVDVHLVVDPWTRESRGFGFVTMSSVKEAERCINYLNRSVLEGRVITVEKVKFFIQFLIITNSNFYWVLINFPLKSCIENSGCLLSVLTRLKVVCFFAFRVSLAAGLAVCSSSSPNSQVLTTTYQTNRTQQAVQTVRAKRRRGRTPTPGRYLGLKTISVRRGTPSHSPHRSPSYSPYERSRSRYYERRRSRSSERSRSRSYSPYYSSHRSHGHRSYSPYYYRRDRSYPRSRSPYSRRDRSYSPYDSRRYYSQYYRRRYYSVSRSPTPQRSSRRSYSSSITCSPSPSTRRRSRRSYSRSVSPRPRRSSRNYSRSPSLSESEGYRRSYSRSPSPRVSKGSRTSYSRSLSPRGKKSTRREHSEDSWSSRGASGSPCSRSVSRSVTVRSTSRSS